MAKFRKKPVVIEAEQWRPGVEDAWMFLWAQDGRLSDEFPTRDAAVSHVQRWIDAGEVGREELLPAVVPVIKTLEGPHAITEGDWIITGVKGERYPCKPDIFAQTYEPA